MNVELRRLKAEDLKYLLSKKALSYLGSVTDEQAHVLESTPHSYSVFVDGELRMCAGVTEYWNGRGESWAVLDPDCKNYFLTIHNVVKRFLFICPIKRIEASVAIDFEAGHRWVKALGFKLEAKHLEAFLPDGKAASLYSRVA